MKTKLAFIALVIAGLLAASAQAEDKKRKKIVIGDPSAEGCRYSYDAQKVASAVAASLRTSLSATGYYSVVTRSQMRKILKEHEMAMTGLIDPENAKSLGNFSQAELVMSVEFICLGDVVQFNVNTYDIETTEPVFSKVYEMKDMRKTSRALRDITKAMKKFAKTGKQTEGGGNIWQLVDSKAFYAATEYMVGRIRYAIPKAYGDIEDVNTYADSVKVNIKYSGYKPWAGLKLKVTRDDEKLGWVYLKKNGRGVIEAGTNDDISSFEEGDLVSSADFEPVVAFGFIQDVDDDREDLVEKFKERMYEIFGELDGVKPVEDKKAMKILNRMGEKAQKKDLAKLHKAGVDLLIVGRFLGSSGNRRLELEAISTYDGKRVIEIKRDRTGM